MAYYNILRVLSTPAWQHITLACFLLSAHTHTCKALATCIPHLLLIYHNVYEYS